MSPVAPTRRRLRPRASTSLSIILFAALAFLSSQLIESAAGAETPTRPSTAPAVVSGPVSAMTAAVVTPPTPVTRPAPQAAPQLTAPATGATAPALPPPGTPTPPPVGQATTWGCGAALAYLEAYAAKGFTFECPGYAEGHEAMTCVDVAGACPNAAVIAIADPCPQAYMNETSNSFVITARSEAPIDPFGPCP